MEIHHDFRTWRFWRHFLISCFSAIGAFSVVIGIIAALFPSSVTHQATLLVIFAPLASVAYGGFRSWPHPIEESYNSPNVRIRVLKGDLFTQTSHLVIGVCDTFDTSVPRIIERSSAQGRFLHRNNGG